MQIIIIVLLVLVLAALIGVWLYIRRKLRGSLNHVHEKIDLLLTSQEGGRAQISQQGDETRHQNSRVMERMQTLLLWFDKFTKSRDKDPPP